MSGHSEMSEEKVAFTFHNLQSRIADLVIEPWALVEEVPVGGIVVIEVNATPPAEVEFSVTEAGQPFIYVMSERIAIHVDGVTKHNFNTEIRPPMSAFRVLNKLLWSNDD